MLRPHGLHLKVLLMIQYHLHNLKVTANFDIYMHHRINTKYSQKFLQSM